MIDVKQNGPNVTMNFLLTTDKDITNPAQEHCATCFQTIMHILKIEMRLLGRLIKCLLKAVYRILPSL